MKKIVTHTNKELKNKLPIKKVFNGSFNYDLKTLLIGLGETGYSCAKFLTKKGVFFDACDTRKKPPYIEQVKKFDNIQVDTNIEINDALLEKYEQLIISPGISIKEKVYKNFKKQGKTIVGDIALFLQENAVQENKPVIAVTGSNGKSTVVTLAEHMLKQAGYRVCAGGNLGIPALDLLEMDVELYILELSSFQLETIPDIYFENDAFEDDVRDNNALEHKVLTSAVLLNVSADHMDRYDSLDDYRAVKESIFKLSKFCVFNKNELLLNHKFKALPHTEFSLGTPEDGSFGLVNENGITYLAQALCCHQKPLFKKIMPVSEIAITGKHNYSNILATLGLVEPFVLSYSSMISAIKTYKGLAHRCEWVTNINQVDFYNDSKGTNVGATIAAINSYERPKILIAGGVGKNADFSELGKIINQKIKHVVLFGEDATVMEQAILKEQEVSGQENRQHFPSIEIVADMKQAVTRAQKKAVAGDLVLFSPACASFDMYKNYIARGEDFVFNVEKQVH